MSEAVSCGGVVIFRGKVLVLYKNFMNSRDGWVLPKGTVEKGETYEQTAVREVNEEAGADVRIRAYIGSTNYSDVYKRQHHILIINLLSSVKTRILESSQQR